jgi:prepilin-type N-terminal cleavage/methylation domain-containing protein
MNFKQILKNFDRIDASSIEDKGVAMRVKKLQLSRAKQAGFTLLELLVVVAILAAIAGTATIALQDTDARASAAAHVAMMDEMNKGIRTYRVLNKNALPSDFDSLLSTTSNDTSFAGVTKLSTVQVEDIAVMTLPVAAAEIMNAGGIDGLRYVHNDAASDPDDAGDCSDIKGLIESRGNAVVPGNIFLSPTANGCGYGWDNVDNNADPSDGFQLTGTPSVAIWTGGYERLMGAAGAEFDGTDLTIAAGAITGGVPNAPVLMAVGLGPSSTLFNANELGGMTSVPVYRHVSGTDYNRFVALFNIGTVNATTDGMNAGDQVNLTAIVDGAGDTKEEELGEWDGTRNTI